jgi:hypothetical protein
VLDTQSCVQPACLRRSSLLVNLKNYRRHIIIPDNICCLFGIFCCTQVLSRIGSCGQRPTQAYNESDHGAKYRHIISAVRVRTFERQPAESSSPRNCGPRRLPSGLATADRADCSNPRYTAILIMLAGFRQKFRRLGCLCKTLLPTSDTTNHCLPTQHLLPLQSTSLLSTLESFALLLDLSRLVGNQHLHQRKRNLCSQES